MGKIIVYETVNGKNHIYTRHCNVFLNGVELKRCSLVFTIFGFGFASVWTDKIKSNLFGRKIIERKILFGEIKILAKEDAPEKVKQWAISHT